MNCEHCHRGDYRLCMATDWRKNPDGIRFGYTSALKAAAPLGRLRAVHVPAVELGHPPGARRPVRRNWRASSRRWPTASSGRCSTAASAIIRAYWCRARASRASARSSPANRPVRRLIIVTGTSKDIKRLDVAKKLGADHVINVDQEDPLERIKEITGGEGVDVALDCTAGAGTIPVLLGIEALKRKGGTLLIQGEGGRVPELPAGQDRQQIHHRESRARPQLRILRTGAATAEFRPLPAGPDHHPPLRAGADP